MAMVRLCLWLLVTLSLAAVPWQAAHTQQKPAPQPNGSSATAPAAATPAATPFGALSPEQARAALDTLNDPKKRAAFAATLESLVKADPPPPAEGPPPPGTPATAAPPPAPPPAPEGIPIQLEPNSLGAQVLLSASAFLHRTANELPRLLETMQSIPQFSAWVVVMVTNPIGQKLLTNAGWRLAVTLALALGVAEALRFVLRRPMARVIRLGEPPPVPVDDEEEDPESRAERGAIEGPPQLEFDDDERDIIGPRVRLGFARFALQMVPVLGFLLVGHMAAATQLGGAEGSRLVILAVLDAIGGSQALLALMTLLFEPAPPGLQLLPLRPAAGRYLIRWTRRLILIGVPGYAIGEVALLLGLSPTAHAALQKAVGLVLMVCLGIIVVQRRRPVRLWLSAPPEATGIAARLRNAAARRWYSLALLFLAAIWLAWTLRAPDAVERIIWHLGATILVLVAAALVRLAVIALLGTIQPKDDTAGSPAHPARVRLCVYQPALQKLATLLINAIAFLGLLQLYGLSGLTWLATSDVGRRV
ncbi:MAG TPA: hypothetical protein VHX39_36025, partial [Acetobacteraceae bacterium]|nr:hypothetical protein [Acetobacteraceae bacterium]